MEKQLYRVFYNEPYYHRGEWYNELKHKVVTDTIENILKKYSVYYLTDLNGDVIIDNRKRGNKNENL